MTADPVTLELARTAALLLSASEMSRDGYVLIRRGRGDEDDDRVVYGVQQAPCCAVVPSIIRCQV